MLSAGDFLIDSSIPILEKQGYGKPMGNKFVLVPSQIDAIKAHIQAYNTAIAHVVADYPSMVLAPVGARLSDLAKQGPHQEDGVGIGAQFLPLPVPIDLYSLDGIHPNSRGYAYIAKTWIKTIEQSYQATLRVPLLGAYTINTLPPQ